MKLWHAQEKCFRKRPSRRVEVGIEKHAHEIPTSICFEVRPLIDPDRSTTSDEQSRWVPHACPNAPWVPTGMNIGEKHVQLLNARRVARARPSAAMISNSRDFEAQRAFVGVLMSTKDQNASGYRRLSPNYSSLCSFEFKPRAVTSPRVQKSTFVPSYEGTKSRRYPYEWRWKIFHFPIR